MLRAPCSMQNLKIMKTNLISILALFMLNTAFSQGFGPQQVIAPNADEPYCVYSIDLDGDGDNDILSASNQDNKIAWYENEGNWNFGLQKVITIEAEEAFSVFAIDLDGDGDNDVLSAGGDEIAWYKNDGNGNFGPQQVITNMALQATSVYSIDLDGDEDNDVLSASCDDNKIAWYENFIYNASIAEKPNAGIAIYPNPASDIIHIQSNSLLLRISVFNILGELIIDMPVLNSSEITVQTQDLVNGIYIIKCYDHNSRVIMGKIIKN